MKVRQVMNNGTIREYNLNGLTLEYKENGIVKGNDTLSYDQVRQFRADMIDQEDMGALEIVEL